MRCGLEGELLDPVVKSRDFGESLGGLWGMKRVVALQRVSGAHMLSRAELLMQRWPCAFN